MEKFDAEWDPTLLPRLLAFARRRLRKVYGARIDQAEDYVHRAIADTLAEKRSWKEGLPLYQHLVGVISSLVNMDAESAENRTTATAELMEETTGERQLDSIVVRPMTPEAIVMEREKQDEWKRYRARILDVVKDDDALRQMAEVILDTDVDPNPRSIAASLNWDVKTVYNLKKKLARRLASAVQR